MPSITFFPVGTADSAAICLDNNDIVIVDYANTKNKDDKQDTRCDLSSELNTLLDKHKKESFKVVCFTHLDKDHVTGAKDYFYFDYLSKESNGMGKKVIEELWVSAVAITESNLSDENARLIRQEARHRLKEGYGIKVFSRPNVLEKFLKDNNLTIDDRLDCIVDAGKLVDTFSLKKDGVEFFVHSPLAWRVNDEQLDDRNENSIMFQAHFKVADTDTYALFGGDLNSQSLCEVVSTTKRKKNTERLSWDILKTFHHTSYKSLDKDASLSDSEIIPIDEVKALLEEYGNAKGIIVSPSDLIPKLDEEGKNPPHKLAADYYDKVAKEKDGEFRVTMDNKVQGVVKPIVIEIKANGASIKSLFVGGASITDTPTRAGNDAPVA